MECHLCCKHINEETFECTKCHSQMLQQLKKTNEAKRRQIAAKKAEIQELLAQSASQFASDAKRASREQKVSRTITQIDEVRTKIEETTTRVAFLREKLQERRALLQNAQKQFTSSGKNSGSFIGGWHDKRIDPKPAMEERAAKFKWFCQMFSINEIQGDEMPNTPRPENYVASENDSIAMANAIPLNNSAYIELVTSSTKLPKRNIEGLLLYADYIERERKEGKRREFNRSLEVLAFIIANLCKIARVETPFPFIDNERPTELNGHTLKMPRLGNFVGSKRASFREALVLLSQLTVLVCRSTGLRVVDTYLLDPLHNLLCLYDNTFSANQLGAIGPFHFYPSRLPPRRSNDWIMANVPTKFNFYVDKTTIVGLKKEEDYSVNIHERNNWPAGHLATYNYHPDALMLY